MNPSKKAVSVQIPQEIYVQLAEQAKRSGRTVPAYIRQIIKGYLRHREENKDNPADWWHILGV